jgi:tripartite-type tricarboxylate transporter receptor subunit TctC
MTALLTGDAAFYFDSPITALPFIRSGKIKALAVTSRTRSPVLPDVPSLAEAGLPDFDVVGWNGLVAPARTPQAIIDRLNAEVVAILRDPQVATSLGDQGVDVVGNAPQEFARIIEADIAKWRDIIRQAGIKLD